MIVGEKKRRIAYMEKMYGPVIVEEITVSYDHWKTTEPDDPTLVCEICGNWLRKDIHTGRLYCDKCDPEDEPPELPEL